jgi:hypothetical protein
MTNLGLTATLSPACVCNDGIRPPPCAIPSLRGFYRARVQPAPAVGVVARILRASSGPGDYPKNRITLGCLSRMRMGAGTAKESSKNRRKGKPERLVVAPDRSSS